MSGKRFAVLLSGCGVFDGTEVHEASAAMVALSRAKVEYKCFAPDQLQHHVINHADNGAVMEESRNVLVESARIARGNISNLADLDVSKYSGIIIPGGFGAAKNLCNWATEGHEKMIVNEHVKWALQAFHDQNKPIGACCISPVILACVFPGCTVTLGGESGDEWPFAGAVGTCAHYGGTHKACDMDSICVDDKFNLVTAPAFMNGAAPIHVVADSVTKMVQEVIKRA